LYEKLLQTANKSNNSTYTKNKRAKDANLGSEVCYKKEELA
jgi:hypothetical protein